MRAIAELGFRHNTMTGAEPDDYDSPWKTILEHALPDFMAFYFPEALEQQLRIEIQQIEKETNMRYVTSIERLALQEGQQQGMHNECLSLIKRLLRRKFSLAHGPDSVPERLNEMPLPALEELAEALLDFGDLEDFKRWLDRH